MKGVEDIFSQGGTVWELDEGGQENQGKWMEFRIYSVKEVQSGNLMKEAKTVKERGGV